MEKVNYYEKNIECATHTFYCDKCGKELGVSEEYDDGWYEELGKYEESFYIHTKGWYKLHKNLCNFCWGKYTNKIADALLELGFEKE